MVKFAYDTPVDAITLNISNTGAKSVRYKDTSIAANVIRAGDIVTFMYNGTYYMLVSIDRWEDDIRAKAPLASPALTGTPTAPTASSGTNTTQVATTAFVQTEVSGAISTAVNTTIPGSYYNKTEIDQKLAGAMNYKGTKATTSALPSSGNSQGDVWHITADGSEWAWNGSAWEELGTAVDLSGYVEESELGLATQSDIDDLFNGS
jgi:hypothetical protein